MIFQSFIDEMIDNKSFVDSFSVGNSQNSKSSSINLSSIYLNHPQKLQLMLRHK